MKQGRPPLQTAGGGGSRSIRCDAGMCVVAADQKFITSHLWHNVGGNLQLVLFFFRCRCHSLQHSQLPLRGRSCLFQLWGMMCGKLELGSKFHLHRGFQDFRIVMLDNWISRIEIHILGMIKVVRCGRLTWMELLYEELTWSSKITGMLFDHHKMNNSGPCEMFSPRYHATSCNQLCDLCLYHGTIVLLYFPNIQCNDDLMRHVPSAGGSEVAWHDWIHSLGWLGNWLNFQPADSSVAPGFPTLPLYGRVARDRDCSLWTLFWYDLILWYFEVWIITIITIYYYIL